MTTQPDDPALAQAWIRGKQPAEIVDFYVPRGNPGLVGPQGPIGPGVIVGTVETNMGPAAAGTVGPIGLTGAKGDPGGLVLGTSLSTNDLNTIVADGIYRQATQTNATLAKNYPIANVIGILYVNSSSTTSYVQQIFYPGFAQSNRTMYVRVNSGGTWNAWRAISSTRVDQTAGRAIYQWDDLNQREQLIYGDTGVRDLSTLLANGWVVPSGGGLYIRRVGAMVSLWGLIDGTNFTTDHFHTPPATGFAPETSGGSYATVISNDYLDVRDIAYDGTFYVRSATKKQWRIRASWTTVQAWPTTLPGVAVGAVTNT